MKKKNVLFPLLLAVLLMTGCFGGSGSSSNNRKSNNNSSSVPFRVQLATMQVLGIDTSNGGEIISISGKKEETYIDGTELWSVSVKFKLCSQCSTDSINTKVHVE